MDPVEKYQQQLLEQIRYVSCETPISEAAEQAYLQTPRHLFVKRYREPQARAPILPPRVRELMKSALELFDGNQSQAAERLGISRNTLRALLEKYGLK